MKINFRISRKRIVLKTFAAKYPTNKQQYKKFTLKYKLKIPAMTKKEDFFGDIKLNIKDQNILMSDKATWSVLSSR